MQIPKGTQLERPQVLAAITSKYHSNMNFFYIFCLMCFGVASITCAPLDKITFYDAIVYKCPSVTSLPGFKDQHLFESCKDWKNISEVGNLTDDNKKEVLCWLYFNAFTQYCNHTQQVNILLPPNITKLSLSAVCDKMEVIPKELNSTNSLHNIIKTADDCKRLCMDEVGWPKSLCSISYYYNLQNNSLKSSNHLIHVPKEPQTVKKSNEGVNQEVSTNPEKASPKIILPEDQTIIQTTEDNDEKLNQNVPNVRNVSNDTAQINVKPDHSNSTTKNVTLSNSLQPQPVKSGEINTNHVVPAVVKKTNVGNSNSGVSLNEDKKQDPSKAIETVNNAPAPPPVVEQNVEVPVDKIPVDNGDFTNDQDLGPSEDVMQPNDRPESEEDMIQEQSDIMPHEKPKPDETEAVNYTTEMDGDSYFFTYFMLLCVIFIVGYVCYHNKQKILALILEGRKGKRQYRGRRPNSANYHKLDTNLEEAITSSCNKNTNNVIY